MEFYLQDYICLEVDFNIGLTVSTILNLIELENEDL